MDFLPKEIEKLIIDYKEQLENTEKYDNVIRDLNNNLKIEYYVPLWESESGYIYKSVKYIDEYFKRFNAIICFCCGRDISLTYDEYIDHEENEDNIDYQLHQLYKSIKRDILKKRYEVLEDINSYFYIQAKEKIMDRLDGFIIGETEYDDNRYQIMIDYEDDVEDIYESDEEGVINLTNEELVELLQDIVDEEDLENVD